MNFYTITEKYILYLKSINVKVPNNYSGDKPFIGVVLELNSIKYFAPLTSYKSKQDKVKPSSLLSFKIYERRNMENKLGMIQLNNMIPVLDSQISLFDIENQKDLYKSMLYKQFEYIKTRESKIKERAKKLHEIVIKKNKPFFNKMCCEFKLLEEKYIEYK